MNIYVARAVPLPPDGTPLPPTGKPLTLLAEVRDAALPADFPFLVHQESGEIIEPVILWLASIHRSNGKRRWVKNTATAQVYALKDFWVYLSAIDAPWNIIDEVDLEKYRDGLDAMISLHTHEILSEATKKARLTHVLAFYDWARKRGLYEGVEFSKRKTLRFRPFDDNPLLHTQNRAEGHKIAALLPEMKGNLGDELRPFNNAGLSGVLRALGPLPSRRVSGEASDPRPSRDRLAAELGACCGLRIDEIAKLRAYQIQDLCPATWDHHDLGEVVHLHLTETKGLRPRKINLPTWLLRELDLYILDERREAIKAAERLAKVHKARLKPTNILFVNSIYAKANAGKAIDSKTISAAFHRAVLNSGLIGTRAKINPDTGESYLKKDKAKHSFHDLRHTFALWTYWRERASGNAEPWKIVQTLLGHASLMTTLRYYLKSVSADEKAVSNDLLFFARRIVAGEDI